MKLNLLPIILFAISSSAHVILDQLYVNGADQGLWNCLRLPSYDGPITDVSSGDMTCNGGPNPLVKISTNVCSVPAGAQVTLRWGHTLDSGASDVIDASHKGPVMVYMAKVSNALTDKPTSGWFKIYEDGYSGGQWAVDKLIANGGKVTVTVPSCIPAGDYLLRGEIIALHSAGSYPGAQFYMECAQIRVTGGGSTQPSTVSIPGTYSGNDPGIKINIYSGLTSYQIPGPRPFSCSGGNPTTTTKPPTTTTTTTTTTKPPTTTSSPPSGGTAPHYGQCGGIGWTGPTTCESPWTCTKSNDYYSQCL